MERRGKSNAHRTVRPCGVMVWVISIFLILSLWRVALVEAAALTVPDATLVDAPARTAPVPETPPAEGQDPRRITPPREPNAPLFAEPPREPNVLSLTEPPKAAMSQLPEANQIGALSTARDELAQRARAALTRLAELGRSRADTPQRQQVIAELRSIHEQMCDVAQQLLQVRRRHNETLDGRITQEQERARVCSENVAKLRAEMEEVQHRMDAIGDEDYDRTREFAAALDQTQREIHVIEQRFTKNGISYTAYKDVVVPKVALSRNTIAMPDSVPMAEMKPEPPIEFPGQTSATEVAQPSAAADANDAVRSLQEQIRQLRAELDAANQRQQAVASRQQQTITDQQAVIDQQRQALANQWAVASQQPEANQQAADSPWTATDRQPPATVRQRQQTMANRAPLSRSGSAADRSEDRRQQRLEAMRQQLQQTGGLPAAPETQGSPYSVGSADRGYRPNSGW